MGDDINKLVGDLLNIEKNGRHMEVNVKKKDISTQQRLAKEGNVLICVYVSLGNMILQVKLDSDASSAQYEKPREYIRPHSFAQYYTADHTTITFDDTNCQYINQDSNVEGWLRGCQVLGFIPDHPTSDYLATESCCHYSLNHQNQRTYRRSLHALRKPAQNTPRVNLKRKRKRTTFTTEQIVVLEGVFQRKPYITREERAVMMNRLQLSEKAIKVWFQNRRRMTDKKCQEYSSDSPSSIDTTDSFSDRLTFIETHIKENTDENGYVTLNDHVMSELVNVIDEYLSREVSFCNSETMSNSTITEDVVMYEPISPASSDYNIIT